MRLGLDSCNQRWPQIIQCWPGPPAQAFPPTNQLLCLCLFKLIQTPSKPGKNTAALVRKPETSRKNALNGPGGWLGFAVRVEGWACRGRQWSPKGQKKPAMPPGLGGRQKIALLEAQNSKTPLLGQVSTENPKTAPGLRGSHLLSTWLCNVSSMETRRPQLQSLSEGR